MHYLLLVITGLLAGMINSIAGGGIFLVIPALIMAGVTGKEADASGSFAVWAGQITSFFEDRSQLPKKPVLIKQIIYIGLFGSVLGAMLLIYTPDVNFEHALPYLNAAATLIFILGPWLKKQRRAKKVPKFVFPLFLLTVGIYGGYFGGGLGMLMLAALSMTKLHDIKQQNAIKLLSASVINFVAIVILTFGKLIVWKFALPAAAGALLGGYLGARYSKRISSEHMRRLVILIALASTIYLFWRFY